MGILAHIGVGCFVAWRWVGFGVDVFCSVSLFCVFCVFYVILLTTFVLSLELLLWA